MGIRLYPSTTNPKSLEKLAGVPELTTESLNKLTALCKLTAEDLVGVTFAEYNDRSEQFYEKLFSEGEENEQKLHHFLINGWGKFSGAGIIDLSGDNYSGSLTDNELIKVLFARNGITADVELCEGICWG